MGSVLVRALLDKSYQVRVLDKLIFTDNSLKDVKDKIELIKADVCNIGPEIMDGVSGVIHLAGFSSEPVSLYSPRYTDLLNHLATERLAKMAKEKGIERFVFPSSCAVYFTFDTPRDPVCSKETDRLNPVSCYSLSKRAAEEALLALTDDSFRPVIFRKGTIYGLSPKMRYDLILNAFTKDAFSHRILTVDAGGQICRPLVDIQDVVWAYIQALELPLEKIGGKIFNISGENWNAEELAKNVQKIIKEKKGIDVKIDVKPVSTTRNYKADNSLFKEIFQFRPKRTMADAVFEIWDHLTQHPEDAANPIYNNNKWVLQLLEAGQL